MIIGETPLPSGPLGVDALNMTMRFGDFLALDKVELKVRPGSFHALLGENGAGKSTLVKCIMGYYHPTEGDVLVGERQRAIANPRDAHALGLGMVYQHFTLVGAMTVAENLVLARDDVPAVVNWLREKRELEKFLARMPFKVPLDAKVSDISAGERQKCEILKQLYLKRRFLILDEPTSVLTPGEADEVLGMLRAMVVNEGLTILMITHKFREVMAFADEVTILRRGKLAGKGRVSELTPDSMARMMIGAEELTLQPPRVGEIGATRLELDKLKALDDAGAVDPTFRAAAEELGGLDVLVNAAGLWQAGIPGHISGDEIDFLLATNIKGTILTNQAAHAVMRGSGARIINFGSAEAVMGSPIAAVYAATKGAVQAWTRSAAKAWGGDGVTVNALAPAVQTPGADRFRKFLGPDAAAFMDQQMQLSIPLGGKLGDPTGDLGPVLVFLAGDGAGFITGQLIPVDGGLAMVGG